MRAEIRELIRRMSRENPLWGSPRIRDELALLGLKVAKSTVEKYMIKDGKPRSHTWRTFIDNHIKDIAAVDFFTVPTVVAYIDDPHRFKTNKSVGSYFGLVPTQDASGSLNRLGHITRNGPGTVRGLLTEAAWHGIRRSPRIRSYFDRIQRDEPDRKKIALVATAHYLVRVMHAMLRTGEVWREEETRMAAA